MRRLIGGLLLALLALTPLRAEVAPEQAKAIAQEAYIYAYAPIQSYNTWYKQAVDKNAPEYIGGFNVFKHYSQAFTPDNKDIVTPNNDTPYSWATLDLRAEPMVLSVPAVPKDRYYVMQLVDMFTFNFAYVGVRATGNAAGNYLIAGPRWSGRTPKGITKVFRSETDIVVILGRTQLNGPEDVDAVKAIQAQFKLQSLSTFAGRPAPPAAPALDFPVPDAAKEDGHDFIAYLNFLLQFAQPPHRSEAKLMQRFSQIGIGPGKPWDAAKVDPGLLAAIDAGVTDARADFKAQAEKTLSSNGLFGSRAALNNDYMKRAIGAAKGLYGNSLEEAWYGGFVGDGTKPSMLHFTKAELPPAKFFWSLTLYTLPDRLLYANDLKRYSIGDRTRGLVYGKDGSLTLYVGHASPGADKESNWLPAPAAPYSLVARIYGPGKAATTGKWKLPALAPVAAVAPAKAENAVPVTPDNFPRAESDLYFSGIVKDGGLGKFVHRREPAAIDNQTVIRLNRDTLYSAAVFDLDAGPAMITLPDAGQRFISMQVIDEDQYTPNVFYGPGSHTLTKQEIGTRYVVAAVRTLVDPNDAKDVAAVHALQDAMKVEQAGGPGTFVVPAWDQASQKKVREALLALASTLPDTKGMFGPKSQVDPVRRLIGSASAWGGNPEKDALYLNVVPAQNDGKTVYALTVNDVPVDGFWSISLYDAKGYYERNALNAYNINNITATKEADGAVKVQFGGCDGKVANCLPIMAGWNYMVRLYRPRSEILSGNWTFPEARPVQ
jgi:hypothetical protein